MNSHLRQTKILFLFTCLLLCLPNYGHSQELKLFRIGTGGKTGVYYPIGKLIAKGLTKNPTDKSSTNQSLTGYIGVAQNSAGSIENIKTIVNGETEAGLVQADIAFQAFNNTGRFKGKKGYKNIRAIASLYPEKFQIVTRKDARILSVFDLKGKNISLDAKGSGTLAVMKVILNAHGLTENDLNPVYLKPVFTHEKIKSGKLQGFVMMAGVPMEAISSLEDIGLSLVPIQSNIAKQISQKYPYLTPGRIPAYAYKNIPETETIQVHALLTVNSDMDEEMVYKVTSIFWSKHSQELLHKGHSQGKSITLETALIGISIPLHEGAKRYYQEIGMMKKEN